jgi:DNA modification methylase
MTIERLPTPYYEDEHSTIYCADCRDVLPHLLKASLVCTDPPYGVAYSSGWENKFKGVQIANDEDTKIRDEVLDCIDFERAFVFGTWKKSKPVGVKETLIWDKGTVGMGDIKMPWFPCTEEIYVIGSGFVGTRTSAVMRHVWRNNFHPTEKPLPLVKQLLNKTPETDTILDPFMGSGTTLVAAKQLGRKAIGIELEEKYCAIAVDRLRQGVLAL